MQFRTKQTVDFWVGGALLMLLFVPVRLLALVLRRDHTLERRRGCAVIKMMGAGSLFLAMPSLQAIRREFPQGHFYLVGTRAVTALADNFDWFDEHWIIDDSSLLRLIVSTARVLGKIARNADHLIDLEVHSRLTTAFGILSLVRNRIGFIDDVVFWRRAFYSHETFYNSRGAAYAFYDLLATWFGIRSLDVPAFNADYRRQVLARELPSDVQLPARFYAIGHACSELAKERQLLPAEWKRVVGPLRDAGFTFVLLGARGDDAFAQTIIAELGTGVSLCGRLDIAQSAKVIAQSAGYIGIDSLLVHLARALGLPTVSLWGPTDPETLLRPYGITERVVITKIACSPCVHVNESPPCQGRRDCMVKAVDHYVATAATPLQRVHAFGTLPTDQTLGWNIPPGAKTVIPVSISYDKPGGLV
jgi:ADP-heptose:LPS heptosyltransferase